MPTVDFTFEDVLGLIVGVRDELRADIRAAVGSVRDELRQVRMMLEEDARAESRRIDRIDRRSANTQRLLTRHLADVAGHGGS